METIPETQVEVSIREVCAEDMTNPVDMVTCEGDFILAEALILLLTPCLQSKKQGKRRRKL